MTGTLSKPNASFWHQLAYAGVFVAMLAGLATSELDRSQVLKDAMPYTVLCLAFALTGLAAKAFRLHPSWVLVSLFGILCAQFLSISSLASTVLFFVAAALVGRRLTRFLKEDSVLVATLVGVFFLTGVVGWLLPFHVHARVVYSLVLAAIIWIERRAARVLFANLREGVSGALTLTPVSAGFALIAVFASLTTTWLPSIQFDDLAYHSMLPSQLMSLGYYRFDLSTQVWATAPWGSDIVHAVIGVIANEESRGSVNLAWFLFSCCALWSLSARLGLASSWRWLAIALYASQPYICGLLGSAQVENELVAATLVLGLVALRTWREKDTNSACILLVLCGLFASLKASQALVVAPFFALCIPQMLKADKRKLLAYGAAALLLAASSYFYSWFLTGNPFIPLFNQRFASAFFPPVNFEDLRWSRGLNWRSLWDLTFSTGNYQETYVGGAGVSALVLGVPLVGALFSRELRKVVACILIALLLLFAAIQYLRYVAPLLVLIIPFALCVLQAHMAGGSPLPAWWCSLPSTSR